MRVHFQVIEGQRRRVQVFEGIVIKRQGAGVRETFTVRKQSFGVGVERTFPLHSPKIEKIEVRPIGDVNRAKLYYLRGKVGKKARVRAVSGRDKLGSRDAAEADRARARGARSSRRRGREQSPSPSPTSRRDESADEPSSLAPKLRSTDAAAEPEAEPRPGPEAPSLRPPARRPLRRGRRRGRTRLARRAARRRRRAARLRRLRDHRVRPLALLNDSKQLLARRARGALPRVVGCAERIAVRVFPPGEIDRDGLHRSNLAGLRAVLCAAVPPAEVCLVDGFRLGPRRRRTRPSSTATTKSAAIAAASIVAKVTATG